MIEERIIPTWEKGKWGTTTFKTREDFVSFLEPLFKEPGKYEFDKTSQVFNEQGRLFDKHKFYCVHPKGTKDYITYWDTEKYKCRNGAIYKNGKKTWYIPRDYYMWLNFLPIYNKEINKFGFAKVRDAQYHMALYELLAELTYKHSAILKKRQIASSYFHCAKLTNQLWFEEGVTLKIGASLKDHINDKNTWKFFVEYKNFLDTHTAWYRPMTPNKMHAWQQQIETRLNGKKHLRGLKGSLLGMTFEKNATHGVGGPCKYFFHEEGGIAPRMSETYEYLRPALTSGFITTGMFIAAGSVGDLDQCEPLKVLIMRPEENGIYAVTSNLLDSKGTIGKSGLFIPEQWSMPPYIDEFGNSLVEKALIALDLQFEDWKRDLEPATYQLRVSQRPRNIAEAFAHRKLSKFPQHLVAAQMQRIEDKTYGVEFVELYRDAEGTLKNRPSNKLPISEFPITKSTVDKEGVVQVWERPVKDPEFGAYYASIDPVSEGKTTTSDSLCSIYVMKAAVQVTRVEGEKVKNFIERDKLVACWTGRFDDLNKTHERLEFIIEWYNAWTIVENNISLFIQHMIAQRKQKYLVPKSQIIFLKDLHANKNVFQEYGWKNTGRLFKDHLLNYGIEYLSEELDTVTKDDGTVVKIHYGIERIPDIMIMKEMQAYQEGLNVDRLVSFCALIAFATMQQSNRGLKKRLEEPNKKLDKSEDFSKLMYNPFRHMGSNGKKTTGMRRPRNPFKNYR